MLEKTIYICEICGEKFNDEESCLLHEKNEKRKEFENRVAYFDSEGNWVDDVDCAFTIYVADIDAFDYVNGLLDESGYSNIPFELFDEEDVLNIFYTDGNGDWRCLNQDLSKLIELKSDVKKALNERAKAWIY